MTILHAFIPYFVHLGPFIVMSLTGNVHVFFFRCTKAQSPEIGTVLHWRPPDVHIFHTHLSLILTIGMAKIYLNSNNFFWIC